MVVGSQRFAERPRVCMASVEPIRIVRYTYYAFILSIPFETVNIGIESGIFSLSKMMGLTFILVTVFQPNLCFRRPPKAFWYFVAYLSVFVSLGILQESMFVTLIYSPLFTLIQMMLLFWISYNLMRNDRVAKGTMLMFAVSSSALAFLQVVGLTNSLVGQTRISALGENPNSLAAGLSLGLLALIALAYGRDKAAFKIRVLTWLCFGVLGITIVSTGSRGAAVSLMVGLLALLTKNRSVRSRLKIGLIVLLASGSFIWASYRSEAVRERWERTFYEGSMAIREKIFPIAWEMFKEKPLVGWGPIYHYFELGSRLGYRITDPHNLYLWILTETGLLGAIPFFGGLWLCWREAWKGRNGIQGVLPMAMLLCLLILNMSGTEHYTKRFWIVLAYALASGTYVALPRLRKTRTKLNQPGKNQSVTASVVTNPAR